MKNMKANWASILGSILDICPKRPLKTKKINVDNETLGPQVVVNRDWGNVAESWYSEF